MTEQTPDAHVALSGLATLPVAVTLETHLKKVDPHTIGKTIAGWDSDQQAAFLTGLADGFRELGAQAGMQLVYVGHELADMPDQDKTRSFLEMLADYLKEDQP